MSAVAHAGLVLIFAAFWVGPLWGLAVVCGGSLAVFLAGLSSREVFLILFPLESLLFGAAVHRGIEQWNGVLRENGIRVGRLEEEANSLSDRRAHLQQLQESAQLRLERYQKLRQLANRLALVLPLDALVQILADSAADLVPQADRVLLYGVNPEGLHLELKRVWRREGSEPIRAKRGDRFDHWVLKHGQPLLVEQAGNDFRFSDSAGEPEDRPLGSVLAVPLATENRLLGVLRLESAVPGRLGSDDLRMCGIVGDLAALAIDNSHLYGQMAHLAMTDDLTGLLVKDYFLKRLEEEVVAARRTGSPLAVLLIDIDHFKGYNDSFGHSAGDKLLRQIGQILVQQMNAGDLAARFGGEEFVCLLRQCGVAAALHRAEAIRVRVESTPIELRRALAHSTVSVGVAGFPEDGLEPTELLKTADRRLYQGKKAGRNRVCASG